MKLKRNYYWPQKQCFFNKTNASKWMLMLLLIFPLVVITQGCIDQKKGIKSTVDFSGNRIQLIVNFGAGGSTDRFARTLAPYLSKYLPGRPTVVVVNKTGAGGVLGASYVYNFAKPDGLTLCVCNGTTMRWGPTLDFPFDVRRYGIVGSTQFNWALVVNGKFAVNDLHELADVDQKLFMSANSPVAPNPLRTRLIMSQMGDVQFKTIGGFSSATKALASVRQGETTLTALHSDYYLASKEELIESQEAIALVQFGFVDTAAKIRRSRNFNLPTFREVWGSLPESARDTPAYKLSLAYDYAAVASTLFALPPDTPENIQESWAKALMAAFNDVDFLEDRKIQKTDETIFTNRAETVAVIEEIRRRFDDPEVVAALKKFAPALRK